jgi:hypothetical protein
VEQGLLALLKQHEEAARLRVEELRAELAALNERIAAAEGELSDLVVTQATLARVLGERRGRTGVRSGARRGCGSGRSARLSAACRACCDR